MAERTYVLQYRLPVGTVLGVISKFSLFRIEIDKEKCRKCNLCARRCKAACIDIPNAAVDHSRCVTCFDCLKQCKHDAIHYRFAYGKKEAAPSQSTSQPKDKGRREVLSGSLLLLASAAKAQAVKKAEIIKLTEDLPTSSTSKRQSVRLRLLLRARKAHAICNNTALPASFAYQFAPMKCSVLPLRSIHSCSP